MTLHNAYTHAFPAQFGFSPSAWKRIKNWCSGSVRANVSVASGSIPFAAAPQSPKFKFAVSAGFSSFRQIENAFLLMFCLRLMLWLPIFRRRVLAEAEESGEKEENPAVDGLIESRTRNLSRFKERKRNPCAALASVPQRSVSRLPRSLRFFRSAFRRLKLI